MKIYQMEKSKSILQNRNDYYIIYYMLINLLLITLSLAKEYPLYLAIFADNNADT